jgi:hypothetical protein
MAEAVAPAVATKTINNQDRRTPAVTGKFIERTGVPGSAISRKTGEMAPAGDGAAQNTTTHAQ